MCRYFQLSQALSFLVESRRAQRASPCPMHSSPSSPPTPTSPAPSHRSPPSASSTPIRPRLRNCPSTPCVSLPQSPSTSPPSGVSGPLMITSSASRSSSRTTLPGSNFLVRRVVPAYMRVYEPHLRPARPHNCPYKTSCLPAHSVPKDCISRCRRPPSTAHVSSILSCPRIFGCARCRLARHIQLRRHGPHSRRGQV